MKRFVPFLFLGLLNSCVTNTGFIPFFPKEEMRAWPEPIQNDPIPVAFPSTDPQIQERARALIDFSRAKGLLETEAIFERLHKLGSEAASSLIEATADSDSDLRFKSTIALGELRDIRAAQTFTHLLNDPSEEVAMMAARSLSHLGEPWVGPALLESFAGSKRHPSLHVRVEAARAAAKLGFPQAVPFLLTVLKENTSLGEPYGGLKDWEWKDRWAWEKWVAGETLRDLSGLDPQFDANQGIPQMESSLKVWIQWWENEGSRKSISPSIRNDLRFQKIVKTLNDLNESSEITQSLPARRLLNLLQ